MKMVDMSKKLELYKRFFTEDINIPLSPGDTFAYGKFKNKKAIYDYSYINEKGDVIFVTDTGKEISAMKVRLLPESKQFSENIRFSDLMKSSSISPFTSDFQKETNKLMGAPTQHTKLKSIKVNKTKDYVTFVWKTKRTPKYPKDIFMKATDKKTLDLKKARLYTIEIRILDFFKLLKTSPIDITNQDIEDVLNVADVQIWSSVPAFQFQGMNYNLTLFDGSIVPEYRPPNYWNNIESRYGKTHDSNQFLDKHTAGVINSIKFYIPQMRQMIKGFLKKNSDFLDKVK